MFRAALGKVNPAVLAAATMSAAGGCVAMRAVDQHRHGKDTAVLQSRVEYYRMHEEMIEAVRVVDRQFQRELQSERDRLAEQAFYAYRELCRLLIDQEAARAFTASDTPGQMDEDDIVLLAPGNTYADDHNARADANPGAIEAAQRRDKARMMIRMLDKPDYWSYAALGFHLRWLPRDSDSAADSVVLREARADLIAAGLLKKD